MPWVWRPRALVEGQSRKRFTGIGPINAENLNHPPRLNVNPMIHPAFSTSAAALAILRSLKTDNARRSQERAELACDSPDESREGVEGFGPDKPSSADSGDGINSPPRLPLEIQYCAAVIKPRGTCYQTEPE
jgi:hypothetical protein